MTEASNDGRSRNLADEAARLLLKRDLSKSGADRLSLQVEMIMMRVGM
jgi:hypothetical protein